MAEVLDITPEMRKAIDAAYRPIKVEGTFQYVPIAFRGFPIEERPVFILKRLDGLMLLRSEDELFTKVYDSNAAQGTEQNMRVEVARGAFLAHICIAGITGWRNYYDLTYVEDKREKLIGCLPPDLLRELANAITERQELTEEEKRGLE